MDVFSLEEDGRDLFQNDSGFEDKSYVEDSGVGKENPDMMHYLDISDAEEFEFPCSQLPQQPHFE